LWAPPAYQVGISLIYAANDSLILEAINEGKAAIRAAGGYRLPDGTFAESHYSMVDLSDRLNHAGRMSEFNVDAVRLAAFGEFGTMLPRGVLPGSEPGNICLFTQDQDQELLRAGEYRLTWQSDGNLVISTNGEQVWTSGTQNMADKLCWQNDGNLVIRLDGSGAAVWATGTADKQHGGLGGQRLKLYSNGALQIVNESSDPLWQVGPFE